MTPLTPIFAVFILPFRFRHDASVCYAAMATMLYFVFFHISFDAAEGEYAISLRHGHDFR